MSERLFEDDPAAPDGETSGARAERESGAGTERQSGAEVPLASRLRPERLGEFVGQEHLLAEGSALRTAIELGSPHSMILYGPPGSGKTTLARMIARGSGGAFEELSAVQAGRPEVRQVLARAAERLQRTGRPTVFFLDEIHRFNKAQQDALLPAVEQGLVTLIGATTENPAFEINGALLSRLRVYALAPLEPEQIALLLRRALEALEPGLEVEPQALEFLAARTEGDARSALNGLELALATAAAESPPARVDIERVSDALQQRAILYDRGGDRHFDYISAWIKATRGSDPDGSLYYLAVMLEGGEDPRFIARRMVILASEDIGNADPGALSVAVAAAHAVELVGLPEARYALAQAAIYLALAPKSDAAGRALAAARAHVREHGAGPVPGWLRSGPRPGQEVGGYENPHRNPGHVNDQRHLSEGLEDARFYQPDAGESANAARLERLREARRAQRDS